MESYIKVENVSFSYEASEEGHSPITKQVLSDVSLEIARGEFVAILGHNGSGKSTLAKLLNSILLPDKGHIYIDGTDVTDENLDEDTLFEIRRKIGMVFQNPDNQLVATVVEEDVAFGPENLGLPSDEIRKRVDDAMKIMGIEEFARHAPSKLSGGQKQRVAIAGVLAMMPECIVFDEATSMLDPQGVEDVQAIMRRINREMGITVINITHNMEEASEFDRVIVINDGKIELDGTPREVFSQVALLNSIGLDVPQTTDILSDLDPKGKIFPRGITDIDECADAIMKVIKK